MRPTIIKPSRTWVHLRWPQKPVDPEVLEAMEDLEDFPGAQVYPLEVQLPRNVLRMERVQEAVECMGAALPELEPVAKKVTLWEPVRPSFDHQRVLAKQLIEEGASFCCDMMGLGKTQAAIQAAETIRRNVYKETRPVIILGPLFVRDVWRRELLETGAIEDESEFCALQSRSLSDPSWKPDAKYYFIHYQIASAWATRLDVQQPCVCIADEAHWVKNGRAKASRAAANIVQVAPFKILLTGTPMQNRPSELWHLLSMLTGRRSWGSPVDFRMRYCGAQRSQWGWQDQGPTNVPELQERMAPIYLRRHPEDIGSELPELTRVIEEVVLKEVNQSHHDTLYDSMTDSEREALARAIIERRIKDNVLSKITSLRKILSQGKQTETINKITNILDQDESVVVFCWLKETAEAIARRTASPVLTGDHSQHERDKKVARFQRTGGGLVATYGVLKEGVTLHKARHVILHDMAWVPSDMLQAEKRIHRIGQTAACTSTWMCAKDTIDDLLLSTLYEKLSAHETIFNERQSAANTIEQFAHGETFEQRVREAVFQWRQR